MNTTLTSMERACVDAVVEAHWPGLRTDDLAVVSREPTGVGLYVYFVDPRQTALSDGVYEAGSSAIEMEAVPFGIDFAVCVSDGRISQLELVSPGPDGWDGVERPWKLT